MFVGIFLGSMAIGLAVGLLAALIFKWVADGLTACWV